MATTYYLSAAIVIEAGVNDVIIFREDDDGTDRTATISAGTYYLYGDGVTDSVDILKAIITAMNAGTGVAATYSMDPATPYLSQSNSTKYTWGIVTDSTSVEIRGADASTTFPLTYIGMTAANTGFAASFGQDTVPTHNWIADQPSVILDPGSSSSKVNRYRTPSGKKHTFVVSDPVERRILEWKYVAAARMWEEDSSGVPERTLENFWQIVRTGLQFRIDAIDLASNLYGSDSTLVGYFVLGEDECSTFTIDRNDQRSPFYDVRWEVEEYVA